MLLKSIYQYKDYPRVVKKQGRHYNVGGTRPLPSVTTILDKTADKEFLVEWKKRVGEAEATKIVKQSTGVGNQMHLNLENYIKDGSNPTGSYFSRVLANLIIKKGLAHVDEVWGIEAPLFLTDLYAGTVDCVGLHNGTPAIIDFKNSKQDKKEEWIQDYFLQLVAYAEAHNEMFGTNIRKGIIMIGCHSGRYQEFIIEGDEFDRYRTIWFDRLYSFYETYEIE